MVISSDRRDTVSNLIERFKWSAKDGVETTSELLVIPRHENGDRLCKNSLKKHSYGGF